MADKIVNQLPIVLQTKAIKNFFEATVEQLYSQANTVPLAGFIGKKTGEDVQLTGAFISENNADRVQYNLSPAVNNVNSVTGNSEDLIFYDEFIDILSVYGVNTQNHNRLFGSRFRAFMPPIDVDKFVNYQEYYWLPAGSSTVTITATAANPINIEKDVIGKTQFTYGTVALRNGMVITFNDNGYTIPANSTTVTEKAGVEYIVEGVGESILLVAKSLTTSTEYGGSSLLHKDYIVMQRGAHNKNAWSRVNHWYHRSNFIDAGNELPERKYRANRPILEFNKDLELYNHGNSSYGVATINAAIISKSEIEGQASKTLDTRLLQNGDILLFPNETDSNKVYLYTVSGVGAAIVLTASTTPIAAGQTVTIANGNEYKGTDYQYNGTSYQPAQRKLGTNQAPLFELYDDAGNLLSSEGLYNNSSFTGNPIFGYKLGTGVNDVELGFALSYTPYKAVSEITFENFIQTNRVTYTSFGATTAKTVLGSYYYKLLKETPEYHSSWKQSPDRNEQRIITTHYITRHEVDDNQLVYNIGATPNVLASTSSGLDILVKVNGAIVTNYSYTAPTDITFTAFTFKAGDIIDIEIASDIGIAKITNSRYDVPLSWKSNPYNSEIEFVAEPEYLSHFKRFIERQPLFAGDPLASNNFASTTKDIVHAKDIVQTDQDLIVAAFSLDDQSHNLVDALRFSGREYEKYRARLAKEIDNFYNSFDTVNLSTEFMLEKVLRNLISYSVGQGVFGTTYVLPFGDNYIKQSFDVADTTRQIYTLSNYADLDEITNSLLVYRTSNNIQELLVVDIDYNFSSINPLIITVTKEMQLGDTVITKLYNKDRDSAECPATPSTLGLYPLFAPAIEIDNSFKTPISVLVGHDGSRTTLKGDARDNILLEFERRLYCSSASQLRATNSLPRLSVGDIRSGAFRTDNHSPREYSDLLRNSFTNWAGLNKVDHSTNEYFEVSDTATWNYRGEQDLPGHWRGWFEYYYDTVRPHTHPWEMLGFFEQPTWWVTQYTANYSSTNTAMWEDLEQGIIRQGPRANFTDNSYKKHNPWRRSGLLSLLPVNDAGTKLTPAQITNTGSTTKTETWTNIRSANTSVSDTFSDSAGASNLPNGINISYSTTDIYVENTNTDKKYQLPNYAIADLTSSANIIINNSTPLSNTTIGITTTGMPILNPSSVNTWQNEGAWHYSNTFRSNPVENATYVITPASAGLTEWSTTEHSPIVGWAFDGIPIYGPYGYTNPLDNTSDITNIKSAFELRSGQRTSGPLGNYTGEFVQDYAYNPVLGGQPGYVGSTTKPDTVSYNMRYGYTPDSPSIPIWFYVTTIDDDGQPMFPYIVGGTDSNSSEIYTYSGNYYAAPTAQALNNNGAVTDTGTTVAVSSSLVVTPSSVITQINAPWRFGDGAPVENAWKYSAGYPFAIAEALLLSRPGRFITVFADPLCNTSPVLDDSKFINKTTRTPFDFRNTDHFRIHGSIDATGNVITNIGFSQFIHSWLTYQQLNTTTDYADKLKNVNIKLAHRVAGFTDKDTLTVKADQLSITSTSSSLIIPSENIDVVVHASPYKNRNFYSGMSIQKTANGYKLRGFDKNFGYFEILRRNTAGRTTSVQVGGEPVDFIIWEPNTSYNKGTIVSYNNSYYEAPTLITASQTFVSSVWKRLPSLPQTGSIKAVIYLDSDPYVDRVDYQSEYKTFQEVVNVIVGLGAFQEQLGYNFGGFDSSINDVRNWNYVVKQFLFWVSGGWETNNTLELSPLADTVRFTSTTGMVAKINRIDKHQFTLIDQDGKAIQPSECGIVRDGNSIEITPPTGIQIYGVLLFTKEIEHALIFDNVTNFNDTLFNPVYGQSQKRLRLKGKRTANWSGLFSSEGFIIQGDELRPNLDNMAQSLGRYHELGFIPVEKKIYEQARGLFGYQERTYLNNLELEDDDQFEFYKGMLQNKGTVPSLSKIAKSINIVQGEMKVYDEWALKAGDFGDLENDQTIELKLAKSDVVHDPQLITLAFPEDTTGIIETIKVIQPAHTYYKAPIVEISAPVNSPKTQAAATAILAADGTLSAINVTNSGTGYTEPVRLTVVAGLLSIANVSATFTAPVATVSAPTADSNSTLGFTNLNITSVASGGNTSVSLNISSATSIANVATIINSNATINASITASTVSSRTEIAGSIVNQYALSITGNDFVLTESGTTLADLNLTAGRFQPTQRHRIEAVGNHPTLGTGATTSDDIIVKVNNSEPIPASASTWLYDEGSRQQINFVISGSLLPGSANDENTVTSGNVSVALATLDTNNLTKENGINYPYANVFVNGAELINLPGSQAYDLTASQLTIYNVETLPGNGLAQGANIFVIESPTINFQPAYFGDVPGASLSIKVTTDDNIAIITGSKRLYEITADDKNDDAILIDIDDTTRFLKKPIGVKQQNLWPTTTLVDFTGITDPKYISIPNAGYVSSTNVDFRSFDVPSIGDMFRSDILIHPDSGDTVHVAVAENQDWNVYRFNQLVSTVVFVEQEADDLTAHLYSNTSLFDHTDENQITSNNTSRYLDYHIAIKDASISNKFVVWVNEQTVNQKQVRLSNITPITMMESPVSSIGPTVVKPITDITPGVSAFAIADAIPVLDGTGTVTIYAAFDMLDENLNSTVGFTSPNALVNAEDFIIGDSYTIAYVGTTNFIAIGASANTVGVTFTATNAGTGTGAATANDAVESAVHTNLYTASNINIASGTFTINEPALLGNIDGANLVASFYNRTQIESVNHGFAAGEMVKIVAGRYSGQWFVEGASANTFIINSPFVTGGPTTGNVLTSEFKITTESAHYLDKNYAGKRIAIHNADQRFYNGVYRVKTVPSANTIVVWDKFPFADEANVNVNDPDFPSTHCVVTTLDHNMISLNNSSIVLENINSLPGMIDALNDSLESRRGWITHQGSFSMNLPMLKYPMLGLGGMTTNQVGGSLPRVTNLGNLSTKNLQIVGATMLNVNNAQFNGFNKSKTGAPAVGFSPLPRTTSSAATVTAKTTTLNTSPTNPVMPFAQPIPAAVWTPPNGFVNPFAGMTPFQISQAITNGIGGAGIGSFGGNTGNGGGNSQPYISGISVMGGVIPTPPSATALPVSPGSPIVVTGVKIKPVTKTNIKPTTNTGAPVLTGTAVHVAPPPKCGELIIPVPPPPPVPPNRAPNGADDNFSTAFETNVSGNVLTNDTDPDGDNFTITEWTVPSHGTFQTEPQANGDFEYIPNPGFTGTDSFTYTIRDDSVNQNESTQTVTISVGQQLPPLPTVYEKCEFQAESVRTQGVNDVWTYFIPASGKVTLIIDMDGAADILEAVQVQQKQRNTGTRLGHTSGTIRNATIAEKNKLVNSRRISGTNAANYGPADFRRVGQGFTYCGVMEFNFDPANGSYLKIKVDKNSSVYRYLICYPTTTNTGTLIPASTPAGNYTGTGSPAPNTSSYPATPTYRPSILPTTKVKNIGVGAVGISMAGSGSQRKSTSRFGVGWAHNYGGFSIAPMAGYTHIPSVFKKSVKTVNPQNVGRRVDLTGSNYVNNTLQRVSGGKIIPLSNPPAAPFRIANRGINGLMLRMYPGSSRLSNSGTMKNITVNHQILQIASSNYDLQNLSNPSASGLAGTNGINTLGSAGYTGPSGTGTTGSTTPGDQVFTTTAGPLTIIPGSVLYDTTTFRGLDTNSFSNSLIPPETLTAEDSPIIDFPSGSWTEYPQITVTPLNKVIDADGTRSYTPAGPTAICDIYRPTPSIIINEDDVKGLTPGDQFIINNKSITVPGIPSATLKQIECAGGNGFTTSPVFSNAAKGLKISSCSTAPITLRDGCRGGVYKEVLDFHVVRSFSLHGLTNNPYVSESNTSGVTTSTTGTETDATGLRTVSSNTTSSGNIVTASPTSTTTVTHTGGNGYTVGDRLRVVGGVPVASPFGSVAELCIEIPGANYSSAANVRIFVGDGTTPGAKASVDNNLGTSVTLNTQGGIDTITLSANGYGYDPARPPVIRIVDMGAGSTTQATIPAKISAIIKTEMLNSKGEWVETAGTPDRVAKFEVVAVDPVTSAILGLKVIDRGVYKEFPSDLSNGIPLEYDFNPIGDSAQSGGSGLGQIDPITGAILPSPGNYDPSVGKYGELTGHGVSGSGARIFLTAREIPDCSEKADVISKLGLPSQTIDYPLVQHLSDLLNTALINAGYSPDDINFSVLPINDDIDELVLNAPSYDGIDFNETTPGFLAKLGIPIGDYTPDLTVMSVVDGTSINDTNLTDDKGIASVINGTDGFGDGLGSIPGDDTGGTRPVLGTPGTNSSSKTGTALPEETMVIYGVDNGGFSSDPTSMLGNALITYVGDLYQYELRNLDGTPVQSSDDAKTARVLYLESERYSTEADVANVSAKANVWIDNYQGNGWAYLENSTDPIRQQQALVDPKYIKNTIIYDATTGQKDFDYSMWDPFKGVLPAFVDAEITFTSKSDPVVYSTRRAAFGKRNVGQVWWDTSTVRYNWYEQGTNRERWLNWGSAFPGSAITLYEWVESTVQPLEYISTGGTGTPKNGSEFIVERRIDPSTNSHRNFYYFWVQNVSTISTQAATVAGRKTSTFNLARYLADPIGQGINTVSFISAGTQSSTNIASFVMGNLGKTLREDEQNIQINLSRNINPTGLKHAAWKLLREDDNNSTVPEDLALKLIDSLCEVDAAGNVVPAQNLSDIERYGVKFRPRQTMFKNAKEARRVLHYIVNELLADTKLSTMHPTWNVNLPSTTYIETVNWYAVQRVDEITNEKIRFDNTFKAAFTVASVKELDKLKGGQLADGQVVMVKSGTADRFQQWRWSSRTTKFTQIAIENETVKLKDTIYTDVTNTTMQAELRALLVALRDDVFVNTAYFNNIFFELLKYALGEQYELDWAFKTSYIYIEKEEEDLVQRVGYKPDNFDSVVEYLNEVKPYTAKIREYKDGKRAPVENINEQMLSDFDAPAYPDPLVNDVRILDFALAADRAVMSTNSDYTKVYSEYTDGQLQWGSGTPVRTGAIKMVFDRTDWRLLEANHNAATTSYTVSIGNNIANINAANIATVSNLISNAYTASGRIFKFDADVRTQFATEIDTYYGTGASSNTSIITDATSMQTAVAAGALNGTLYLVKEKVGGTYQGEVLDANVFTMTVNGEDSLALQTAYGYDSAPFDFADGFGSQFDSMITVQNFEGLFNGNSTYREGGVTYSGFDSATFSHLLYGEERPEELVYLSPLENFVMHVRTDPIAYDANNEPVASISVGPYEAFSISESVANVVTITSPQTALLLSNADVVTLDAGNTILNNSFVISNVTSTTFDIPLAGLSNSIIAAAGPVVITSGVTAASVEYIVHHDLFGGTEYLRILTNGDGASTTVTQTNAWDTEITVRDASKLPIPKPGIPGAVWLDHSERVEYTQISGNTLKGVTRGTRGTTVPSGPVYVYDGNASVVSNMYHSHASGVAVVSAGKSEVFDATIASGGSVGFADRDPMVANWLNADGSQLSITDITNRNNGSGSLISAFLHGDSVSSIGFDSRGWDAVAWDSI